MGGRLVLAAVLGVLAFAPAAQAENFSLSHSHSGTVDATAQGSVTFPETTGGAAISITVTDRDPDGWCAQAWVTSNLPPATHKTYRVCGAAKQQTWAVNLPTGARCNVTFVEVQLGRIDPSNGDKIELGQSKRMANPCPPLPAPTPVPTPAPAPPPPPPAKIESPVTFQWSFNSRWTRNTKLVVREVPSGATVQLLCRGRGCPTKPRTLAVKNGTASARSFLRRRHLRVGTRLDLSITAPGMIGKVLRFKVRRRAIPSMTRYCLPPGATAPQRC